MRDNSLAVLNVMESFDGFDAETTKWTKPECVGISDVCNCLSVSAF